MRIILLAKSSNFLPELLSSLSTVGSVELVVLERPSMRRKLQRLWRRTRFLGWLRAADQLAYLAVRAVLRARPSQPPTTLPDLPHLHVTTDVNDAPTRMQLSGTKADVAVVWGTSVLAGTTLTHLPALRLGYHAGWLPAYRGTYGAFWALHEGRADRVGSTIFEVVGRLDAGRILRRRALEVDPSVDNHLSLIERQQRLGVQLLLECLLDHASGTGDLPEEASDHPGRVYSHPGLTDYIRFMLRTGMS